MVSLMSRKYIESLPQRNIKYHTLNEDVVIIGVSGEESEHVYGHATLYVQFADKIKCKITVFLLETVIRPFIIGLEFMAAEKIAF